MGKSVADKFLECVITSETLYPPRDNGERAILDTICEYYTQVYSIFSSKANSQRKQNWLKIAIADQYDTALDYAKIKDGLGKLRKALETLFEGESMTRNRAFPYIADRAGYVLDDKAFAAYTQEFYAQSIEYIDTYTKAVDAKFTQTPQNDRAMASALDFFEDIQKIVKAAQGENQKAKESSETIMPNILTILGIFVAIVIVFIGAYMSILLTHDKSSFQIPQVNFLYVLLVGQLLTNILFLFIFFISKLSGRSIHTICRNEIALRPDSEEKRFTCRQCRENCSLIKRAIRKYPYIVAINIGIIIAYVVVALWWYVDEFIYAGMKEAIEADPGMPLLVALGIIVVVAVIVLIVKRCRKARKSVGQTAKKEGALK